jgi:hypothetical protein
MITYKLNIENLEKELKDIKFTSLLEKNYEIVAYIPVIDENKPMLIVLLDKKQQSNLDKLEEFIKTQKIMSIVVSFLFFIQTLLLVKFYMGV